MTLTPSLTVNLASLPDWLFPSTCNILGQPATQDVSGQPTGSWAAVTGLSGIKCRKAPLIEARPQQAERRYPDHTTNLAQWVVLLKGYYPTITDAMRAQIDNVVYTIIGIEADGGKEMTRLRIEQVN